jgi:AbiV family abortive infection protein
MAKYLSPEQIVEGIAVCSENVESLFDDALSLFKNKKYARAASLAVSCLEECGKIEKLKELFHIEKNEEERLKTFWKNFRSHEFKTTTALATSTSRNQTKAIDAMNAFHHFEAMGKYREQIRRKGLYTDFDEQKNNWDSPRDILEEEAGEILYAAQQAHLSIKADRISGMHSLESLTLRNKHFEPLWIFTRNREVDQGSLREIDDVILKCQISFFKDLLNKNLLKDPTAILIRGLSVKEFLKKFDSEYKNE